MVQQQMVETVQVSLGPCLEIFCVHGSHVSWNSCNILDFNATPEKLWNSPYFSIHPWKENHLEK